MSTKHKRPSLLTRRGFVAGTAALGLSAIGLNAHACSGAKSSPLRTAVVGFGGRGKSLIEAIRASSRMKLVGLCDVDQQVLMGFEPSNSELFRCGRLEELLKRDDVDAIASATPNHWHALLTVRACAAGKHVYIEKPISHNMLESRQVVAAARHFDRLVQCGFQNRSDPALRPFFERLQQGEFGQVLSVHGTCHRARDPIGLLPAPLSVPSGIDYEEWLGPAADLPIFRPKLHYDWHWDFNTGNGDVGNQGPHEWDLMNWALGDPEGLPSSMLVAGNRFAWNDAGNTPNVMACSGVSAGGVPFSFEVMDLRDGGPAPQGVGVGVLIETGAGVFAGGRGGGKFTFKSGEELKFERDPAEQQGDATFAHMDNFAEAVQAQDSTLLRSGPFSSANSSSMAHMANIGYRLSAETNQFDLQAAFNETARGREMIARLAEAPGLFASKQGVVVQQQWRIGPVLDFDSMSGSFRGPSGVEANRLMSRNCRHSYAMPQLPE